MAVKLHSAFYFFRYILLKNNFGDYRLREPLKIQCRAEVRKIYGRILSKRRSYTDVYQGALAKLCREDFALMRGREFLEVPLIYMYCFLADKIAVGNFS